MRVHTKAYSCPAEESPDAVKKELASRNPGSLVQTLKPFGEDNEFFLEMIAAQTMRADAAGALLAKKPEVDFLLRLAGTTQISRAIGRIGSKAGDPFLAVVSGRGAISTPRELGPYELERRKLSRRELELIEKAALLDAERG